MRTTRAALIALAAVVVVAAPGCSSSASNGSAPPPTPLPTTTLACSEVAMTAAHLTTKVHYVAIDVGTSNDSTKYQQGIDQALGPILASAPTCHPQAVDELSAFSEAVSAMEGTLAPGTDAATVAAKKAALAKVRSTGTAAWQAMGLPTVAWENAPEQ